MATKFRKEQADGNARPNLMRQYYDLYSLLDYEEVRAFIGTEAYETHKKDRFSGEDYAIPIKENEAFLLKSPELRLQFRKRYEATAALYYKGQPDFDLLIGRISEFVDQL